MSPCCEDCPEPGDPAAVLRNPVYLGLGSLPEDKYRIEECAGEPGDCYSGPAQEVVYAWSVPSPMFFIDLLFTRPPGVTTGVYPVDLAEGTVTPTQYFLEFSHRSTTWNYYIVSTGKPLTDLQVETVAAPPGEPVSFIGPQSVTLTNQQKASRFVSDVSVPLQEQSDFNFQLKGKAGGLKPKGGVLVSRLPVASSLQVIPGVGDFATGGTEEEYSSPPGHHRNYSDIYVYI
jgi:hypothetical protein